MKKFKNPKAQKLFDEAEELESQARQIEEKGVWTDLIGDLYTEAAALRLQADDIENEIEDDDLER